MGVFFKSTPLAPFDVICGQSWAADLGSGPMTDVDWYETQALWEDSLTWCVTAEFDFVIEVWHYPCIGGWMLGADTGLACDTVCVSARSWYNYPFAATIYPLTTNPVAMPCESGPWNYNLSVIRNCGLLCPEGGVDEGEGCSVDPSVDTFNGGCFSIPEAYSSVTPGVPVCGQVSSRADGWRDSDWYRSSVPLEAGDFVSWSVTAEFPTIIAIIDQRYSCYTREVGGALGDACARAVAEWKVDTSGIYCFIVGVQDTDYRYSCDDGPWRYTAALELCEFDCLNGGTPEGETCLDGSDDYHNGGCNSPTAALQPISVGDTICGETWLTSTFRDTDWFVHYAEAGEVLTWTVRAEFVTQMGVVDLSNGCQFGVLDPVGIGWDRCLPVSITYTTQTAEQVLFFVAPEVNNFSNHLMLCAAGPWEYEAVLERATCECQCDADPECDGVVNIFDVTRAVNVAFRGAAPLPDPHVQCPWETTDVDCSGATNIFDVTRLINVAFRGGDPTVEFCDPCLANNLR